MATAASEATSSQHGNDQTRAQGAPQAVNFFIADMQAGIGINPGLNPSITDSLTAILWLPAIRREGEDVDFSRFLKVGSVTKVPA